MNVTFLRHAKSIFNELQTSDPDCELSETGKAQAADLSGNWDLIVVSPMKRTLMTHALSSLQSQRFLVTNLCREWKQDICDFLPHENSEEKETQEELEARVEQFKEWLRSVAEGAQTILVITHADFVKCLNKGEKYLDNAEFWSTTLA